MARRAETPQEREARDRLKKRHAAEVKACGKFFDIADRRTALETELARLERDEADVIAKLAALADATAVAEMIGWPVSRVRAASKVANGSVVDVRGPGGGADTVTPPGPDLGRDARQD